MSNFFSIAAVTEVLKSMLSDALASSGLNSALSPPLVLSATSPDQIATGSNEKPQLNLFMYAESYGGTITEGQNPNRHILTVNLHYLVSAYGKSELDPQLILAWAMETFYENPVIAHSKVQSLLATLAAAPGAAPELKSVSTTAATNLIESIRITPETLTVQEIATLWTAFQSHYRPTAAYQVTVLLNG